MALSGRVLLMLLTAAASASRAASNADAALFVDLDCATEAIDSSATHGFTGSDDAPFWVGVRVNDAKGLDSYEFKLAFDRSRLAFVRAVAAIPEDGFENFLESKGGSAPLFIGKLSIRDSSRVTIGNSLSGSDSARSPGGSGLLALIQFRPLAAGMARFDLEDGLLLDWKQDADTPAVLHGAALEMQTPVAARFAATPRMQARWAGGRLEFDAGEHPAALWIADARGKEIFRLDGLRGSQSLALPQLRARGGLILLRTGNEIARIPASGG